MRPILWDRDRDISLFFLFAVYGYIYDIYSAIFIYIYIWFRHHTHTYICVFVCVYDYEQWNHNQKWELKKESNFISSFRIGIMEEERRVNMATWLPLAIFFLTYPYLLSNYQWITKSHIKTILLPMNIPKRIGKVREGNWVRFANDSFA